MYTSHSDIKTYLTCRRKWDFNSSMRMSIVPRTHKVNSALWFGTMFHTSLELLEKGYYKDPFDCWCDLVNSHEDRELPEDYMELSSTAMIMLDHYMSEWYQKIHNKYNVLHTEYDFNIPLVDDLNIKGTFDLVLEDKETGEILIGDYKTATKMDSSKLNDDFQVTTYLYVASKIFNRNVNRFVYIQFSKTPPSFPNRLKDGSVSCAKSQPTTPSLYRKFCEKVYGSWVKTPKPQKNFVQTLTDAQEDTPTRMGDRFFRLDVISRSSNQIKYHIINIKNITKEMVSEDLIIYPNPNQHCGWCDYKGLCMECNQFGSCIPQEVDYVDKKSSRVDANWKLNFYHSTSIDLNNLK